MPTSEPMRIDRNILNSAIAKEWVVIDSDRIILGSSHQRGLRRANLHRRFNEPLRNWEMLEPNLTLCHITGSMIELKSSSIESKRPLNDMKCSMIEIKSALIELQWSMIDLHCPMIDLKSPMIDMKWLMSKLKSLMIDMKRAMNELNLTMCQARTALFESIAPMKHAMKPRHDFKINMIWGLRCGLILQHHRGARLFFNNISAESKKSIFVIPNRARRLILPILLVISIRMNSGGYHRCKVFPEPLLRIFMFTKTRQRREAEYAFQEQSHRVSRQSATTLEDSRWRSRTLTKFWIPRPRYSCLPWKPDFSARHLPHGYQTIKSWYNLRSCDMVVGEILPSAASNSLAREHGIKNMFERNIPESISKEPQEDGNAKWVRQQNTWITILSLTCNQPGHDSLCFERSA